MRRSIVSANLDEQAWKIYKKLMHVRKERWFSKWVSRNLIRDFGTKKKILLERLNEKQAERNKLDDEIKQLAKELNKIK